MHSTKTLISTLAATAFIGQVATASDMSAQVQEESIGSRQADKKYTMTFETTKGTKFCKSNTAIEFLQMNTFVSVEGEINVDDCVAASGEYTISIRIRDENGETQNLDFEETWQRTEDVPVIFAADYQIGDNVDLIRVRARRTKCICNDPAPDDGAEN